MTKRVLFSIFFLFVSVQTFAVGSSIRGGGDTIAAEFYDVGNSVIDAIKNYEHIRVSGQAIDVSDLQEIWSKARVESTSVSLSIDGRLVEAINYPQERRIVINRKNWRDASPQRKAQLVVHEILGLGRIPDDAFKISLGLMELAVMSGDLSPAKFSSRATCEEKRTFNGTKAKSLVAALMLGGWAWESEEDERISIPELTCQEDFAQFDGLPSSFCYPSTHNSSSAHLVAGALDALGVESNPGSQQVTYNVKDLECKRLSGSEFQCSMESEWSYLCPEK